MLRATFRSLLARKLRLLLSAMAIVLGVSFTAGAFTLTDSLGKTFDDLFSDLGQNTDAVVRAQSDISSGANALRAPVDAALLDQLASVDGVSSAEGSIGGYAQIVKANGKAYSPGQAPSLGVNWDDSPELSSLTLRRGAPPTHPDQIAIDAFTAEKTGFDVGDQAQVVLASGVRPFTISGVFGVGDSDSLAGASVLAFSTPAAQELIGRPGEFDSLLFSAEPGVSQEQLTQALSARLPAGFEAITGKASSDETTDAFDDILSIFNTFLLVFAGISLFVGAFLIFNTFTILVAQRSRELALLRALGASRWQVIRSVLVEAGVVGLIASLVGLGVGIGIAAGLKAIAGDNLPSGSLLVEPRTVWVSVALGVVITLLAAALPARKASGVPPVTAMRDAEIPDVSLRRSTIWGSIALAFGLGLTAWGLTSKAVLLAPGGILLFLGIAGLAPRIARPVTRLVGAPLSRRVPGRLGRLNAMRNPRRTSSTAAALMIGLALVTGVSVLGASLKESIDSVVGTSLTANVIVQQSGAGFEGIPANVAPAVEQLPEVGAADVLRQEQAQVDGSDEWISAVSTGAVGRSFTVERVAGDVSTIQPGTVLMSEDAATSLDLAVGAEVPVEFARGGNQQFRLAGIYEQNELAGDYLFDISVASDFSGQLTSALLLSAAPGTTTEQLKAAVNGVLTPFPTVEGIDRDEFTEQISDQVNGIINFVTILLVLSVIIAILGIINTLALSVFERTREIGLLRAVGLGRRQTRSMIRVEAVVVSIFGSLLGIVVGGAFGVAAQQALADDGIPELAFPYFRVVLFLVLAALAGVLAALLPARRAARLDVLKAIATT